jgi:D-hydroxyproline dehydrogenase subunit beta
MNKVPHFDVAIVGSGIVGLAHAWSAAERGLSVVVFDRHPKPQGASIRNFGMVWPVGQSPGVKHETALLSRQRWLKLKDQAGLWVNPCGSLHLAHHEDEMAVLEEFHNKSAELGYDCAVLNKNQTIQRSAATNPSGLKGSLWSPTELCVDPRQALCDLPDWLAKAHSINFQFKTLVTQIENKTLRDSSGRSWVADRILVCSGADFQTLFPGLYSASPMTLCKLQMMATEAQPDNWRTGPHLASGLTLGHYSNFEICASLKAVKERFQNENPLFDRYGIHVMISQGSDGSVILGDSHEYDDDIDPFRKSDIDQLIINEAKRLFQLKNWTITRRWDGLYAKNPGHSHYSATVQDNVHIINGLGGAGMTMSFGLAERHWNAWLAHSTSKISK